MNHIDMRKIIITLLFVLSLALVLTPAVLAENEYEEDDIIYMVYDDAGILTPDEYWDLNDRATEISDKYQCDVIIVVTEEMDGSDAYEYAMAIYEENNFGYGESKSGLMLLLSMAERDYALIAHGYGNTAFTDHGKDIMLDNHILPLLGSDKYYDAFNIYLDKADEYLSMARNGNPFDVDTDEEFLAEKTREMLPYKLAITIIVPLVIAGLICNNWKSKMKTAATARAATQYIPKDGFNLTGQEDRFLFRTETRRKIEKDTKSGGTTKNSKGYSGRSGKF